MPIIPHGASLSLRGPGRTGGTRVQPPLCGGGTSRCAHNPPGGVPIPPRPRQDRRDSGATAAVWGWNVSCAHNPPRGVPIPPRPRQDRRDSGATAAVWGRYLTVCP